MSRPKLTYFDMRGRAEAIRLLLHATETEYDDHRVVSRAEWAALKPDLPFGVLPTYEDSGFLLCESHAILRYLGRVLTPAVKDAQSSAELDAAHDAIAELQEDLWRFNWRERYYDHLESYARTTLLPRLGRLQAWFSRHSNVQQWFGTTLSHVDCLAFCYLDEVDAFFPAALAQFPDLAGLRVRIASLPGISECLGSSRRPLVFGMGRMGPKVDPRFPITPESLFCNPWTEPIDLARIRKGQRRLTSAA